MMDFLLNNWSEISLAIGGVGAFLVGKRTRKNDNESGELQNIEKVREIEKQLLEDMDDQIEKLMTKNKRVMSYNDKLELVIEKQAARIQKYEDRFGKLEELEEIQES